MSTPPDRIFPLYILTPRLVLRNWTLDDLPAAHSLYANPEVMHWSPAGPSTSLDDTRAMIEGNIASYRQHGIGKWAVALRTDGTVIGACGVAMEPVHGVIPEPELGYRLLPKYQRQGYATEAAKAALDHCLNLVGLPRVLGIVESANAGSVRVLLKLGMTLRDRMIWRGKTVDIYAIERSAKAARQTT